MHTANLTFTPKPIRVTSCYQTFTVNHAKESENVFAVMKVENSFRFASVIRIFFSGG